MTGLSSALWRFSRRENSCAHSSHRPMTDMSAALPLRKRPAMVRRQGLFSLGGALSRVWRPRYPLLPWALTSALLMTAGMWDYWSVGGRIEWVVVGLAAYELMLGLSALPEPAPTAAVPLPVSIPAHETAGR